MARVLLGMEQDSQMGESPLHPHTRETAPRPAGRRPGETRVPGCTIRVGIRTH